MIKKTVNQKTETRDKILNAALDSFLEKGYHNTRMDDIVNESGLSKGTLYWYFENKEALFISLMDHNLGQTLEGVNNRITNIRDSKIKLAILLDYFFPPNKNILAGAKLMMQSWSERIIQMQSKKNYKKTHDFITDIFREGTLKGEIKKRIDIDSVAAIFIASYQGLIYHQVATGLKFDWVRLKSALMNTLEGVISPNRG
jgi:AcrR family transcriptional regulator